MYLCSFVALSVWMCVAGANKGLGSMRSILSSFTRLKVFRSIALKYLHNPNAEYSDAAV